MRAGALLEPGVVAAKELTQLANRRRFHVEKFAFIALIAGVFAFMAFMATDELTEAQEMASFGRGSFFWVSIAACVMLSVFSLASASGIIMAEAAGKRLDILRITPLSLRTIVLGKGLAIVMKSLLILALLSPILAATQFYGGVSMSEVTQVLCVIFADVVLCTGLGLLVSAGARSNLDRAFRGTALLVAWLALSAFGFAGLAPFAPAALLAASPLSVWVGLMLSALSWGAVLVNLLVMASVGVLFAALSVPVLRRAVRRADERAGDPKVKDLLGGIRRIRVGGRKRKAEARQRQWVGTLVGNECIQTSLLPIVLPLAVSVPPVIVMAAFSLFGWQSYGDRDVLFVASVLLVVVTAMIALQASAAIAREKQRRTAEVLSTTPAGGSKMLLWKSAAIFLTQSVTILLCLVLVLKPSIVRHYSGGLVGARLAGWGALVVFAWAAGISFSAAAKTPFGAAALLGLSLFVLAPLAAILMEYLRWWSWFEQRYQMVLSGDVWRGIAVTVAFAGAALAVFRQRFPRSAGALLAVGIALVLAALPVALDIGGRPGVVTHIECIMRVLSETRFHKGEALSMALALLALSALLVGGTCFRFTRVFLHGARPEE